MSKVTFKILKIGSHEKNTVVAEYAILKLKVYGHIAES